jgi:hypothetical protein
MQQMVMLTTNANNPQTRIAAGGARINYPTAIAVINRPPTKIYAPPPFKISSSSSRIILPVVEDAEVAVVVVRVGAAMAVDKCHLPKSSILPLVAPAPSPTSPQGFSRTIVSATPSSQIL